MIPDSQTTIDFLYTNVGRGHPHYLDGIIECLPPDRVGRVADVFSTSVGSSRLAWSAVQRVYRAAGRSGLVSTLYSRMRAGTDYNGHGLSLSLLGRGLARTFPDANNQLLVAHPLLVAIMNNRPNLLYQHGEVVAPRESWVTGPHRILVPLPRTADTLLGAGFSTEQIFVSGLCIEPELVCQAESARDARLHRLSKSGPLCGAFFSSGAEPRVHISSIVSAALSAVGKGGRALVFAQRSGTFQKHARRSFAASGCDLVEATNFSDKAIEPARALLCLYENRRQLMDVTARLFPLFDYFVAPSHERTSWALGLGLPMLVIDPPLGSYAPLNRQLLLEGGVAAVIADRQQAAGVGEEVARLQTNGELQKMSDAGWQRYDIGGFENIAELLVGL